MAFVAEGPSSALPALMGQIEDLGMTLVSCHDRPAKTELGHYRYLIEVAGPKAQSFKALSAQPGFSYRNLGTFSLH
jgi:prephenate dehydratase